MESQVVRASQLQELVINRIGALRNPDARAKYEKKLAQYKRRLGNRKEEMVDVKERGGLFTVSRRELGFVVDVYDEKVPISRPTPPEYVAWSYSAYDRSGGFTSHARSYGLLADSAYNREIRPDRVAAYQEKMQAGEWRDVFSDPIAVTPDGQVENGQHRLAAASRVDWSIVENDPQFLVLWGVDPSEALYADRSRRTDRDQRVIATKIASAARRAEE